MRAEYFIQIAERSSGRYCPLYAATHGQRWSLSFEMLTAHIPAGTRCLDVSWPTPFTDALVKAGYPTFNYQQDIRRMWMEYEDGSLECVLLMEVVEHLTDTPPGKMDTFSLTGINTALKECHRVLKPNGVLFLTTPNICSAGSLRRMVTGGTPMLYANHVREYGPGEMAWLINEAGLKVDIATTKACYGPAPIEESKALVGLGAIATYLEDTMFIIARKP
jgi:SAM-dependent methyltransferase